MNVNVDVNANAKMDMDMNECSTLVPGCVSKSVQVSQCSTSPIQVFMPMREYLTERDPPPLSPKRLRMAGQFGLSVSWLTKPQYPVKLQSKVRNQES